MNFFQSQKYVFNSPLSEAEVLKKLEENVQPKTFRISPFNAGYNKRFEGKTLGNNFRIYRVILYRNSFLPILHGKITPISITETQIEVKMKIHRFVYVFSLIWFIGFGVGSIAIALATFGGGGNPLPVLSLIIPIGIFYLFNYFYKKEVKLSIGMLSQILETELTINS